MLPLVLFVPPAAAGLKLIYASTLPETEGGRLDGLARIAALVADEREKGAPLFLFGGNSLGPSRISSLDKGAHIVDLLNQMKPDAMGVSRREFVFREDELSLRASEAAFPLVVCNLFDPQTGGNLAALESGVVTERDGMRVGVTAVMGQAVLRSYPPRRARPLDALGQLSEEATRLRALGAEYIICMADFVPETGKVWVESGLVDVLLCNDGEQSERVPTSRGLFVTLCKNGGDVTLIEVGENLMESGVVFVALDSLPEDRGLEERIGHYRQIDGTLEGEFAFTSRAFNTMRHSVRTEENTFADFVADRVRLSMETDIVLINGGTFRGDMEFPAGSLLRWRDINRIFPFPDIMVKMELSGADVLAALENGLAGLEGEKGAFPQVSGVRVVYAPSRPAGSRVVSVTVNGKALDPKKRYTLAATEYLADGGDGYDMLARSYRPPQAPLGLADFVLQEINGAGEIAPCVDGRLSVVSDAESRN